MSMEHSKALWLAAAACSAACILGCSSHSEEIQAWMQQQKSQTQPTVKPLAEPKKYIPYPYEQALAIDPFNKQKLTSVLQQAAQSQTGASAALIAPEMNRTKEPLEAYPLDAMTMVGSIKKAGKMVALVKVENLLYQVQAGQYLGQNYGKVTQITENELQLREITQDSAGEWVERQTTLQLQEKQQ